MPKGWPMLMMLSCFLGLLTCQTDHTTQQSDPTVAARTANETALNEQVEKLLGKDIQTQLLAYRNQLDAIKTVADIAVAYAKGLSLRDTLVSQLEKQLLTFSPDSLPDLFWLQEAIPTHQPQLVAEGTSYFFFNDYQQWLEIAQRTPSTEDDEFMALNIALYPEDSIEYFYPVWFMQTWDYGGASLLGRGEHQKILQKATIILPKMTQAVFKKELQVVKDELINDILSKENTYWERKTTLLVELDGIINSNYAILSENDLIALKKRRAEFNDPEKFNIQLNQQSGM